jgi:phosphoribosyl 1,2-cyclic phosphate phosphodiesterase
VDGTFSVAGICFEPLPVYHGELEIVGYKFLNCAYLSDVSRIPEDTLRRLYDLDILILDVLRYRSHSTHFNLSQALEIIKEVKPGQTYLTHLCHDVIHREINQKLGDPEDEYFTELNVQAAYDGLVLELD